MFELRIGTIVQALDPAQHLRALPEYVPDQVVRLQAVAGGDPPNPRGQRLAGTWPRSHRQRGDRHTRSRTRLNRP